LVRALITFLLLCGKNKKDNKKEEPPATAPKLKIAKFFLSGKNALRLNGLSALNEKVYDFLHASPLNAGDHPAR